jgi:pyrroloquinoline-quinone synthase
MRNQALDAIVTRHDLNQHPFYQAWRAGTLPAAALGHYAAEYEPFIRSIELGWRTLGESGHADVEREHGELWASFRHALAEKTPEAGMLPSCPETAALVDGARASFTDTASALGALYAFEAQQPSTARSKLDGLVEHYGLPESALAYFRDHADDYGERELLRARLDGLDAAGLARATAACERTCRAMWSALDGVLAASGHTATACS